MKLGVVGKGGVGKTTVSSLLAASYVRRGLRVVAIDTDSNPNLGMSLGLSFDETEAVPVLPRSVVTGPGGPGSAASILSEYGRPTPAGALLVSAMRVDAAGAGCTCGGHATVRSLLGQVLDEQVDVTIVDMEAGLEHLSRAGGTLAAADVLIVVMEPSRKAIVTAARTVALARELGIPRTYGIGNKARATDAEFFTAGCTELGLALGAVLPYEPDVVSADRIGEPLGAGTSEALREEIDRLAELLLDTVPAS